MKLSKIGSPLVLSFRLINLLFLQLISKFFPDDLEKEKEQICQKTSFVI